MHCPSCQFDNPAGVKFCIACGASLKNQCSACGVENLPQAKFCGECGTALTSKSKGKRQKSKGKSEDSKENRKSQNSELRTRNSELTGAERRQLTVMFCDLVGLNRPLRATRPRRAARRSSRRIRRPVPAVIRRFEGHLAKYLGDGLLVYFGYPVAHEDDAQRAVRAGLGIVEAMQDVPPPRAASTPPASAHWHSHRARGGRGDGRGRPTGTLGDRGRDAQHCRPAARESRAQQGGHQCRDLSPGARACLSVRSWGHRRSKASRLPCRCIASWGE